MLLGLRRVGGQLDPAGLAAPADEHLRLHDHRAASSSAAALASAGVSAMTPSDTGIP